MSNMHAETQCAMRSIIAFTFALFLMAAFFPHTGIDDSPSAPVTTYDPQ